MFVEKQELKVMLGKISQGDDFVYENINHICDVIDRKEVSIKALVPEENRRARLLREAELLIGKYPDRTKRPPLFGIPIGVKDIFITDGFETRCGSQLPPSRFKGREATPVTRLKNAGVLVLGKTVTTEFAYFEPGPTRNPYNLDHTPGGSSSGSAAAVACGYTPLALGTQTIGSITRPASFCGIVGFKPSFGRIPADGVIPFSPSADHVGFFVQDLEDVSVVAPLLCENWNAGSSNGGKPLKIGAVTGPYIEQSDSEVQRNYRLQIDAIRSKGHKVVEIDLFGDISGINELHRKMVSADFALTHQEWFAEYSHLYRTGSKELILEGYPVTIRELIEARKNRYILRSKIEKTVKENAIDFFISPSTVSAAPRGMATGSPLMNLPWTFAGLPTLTLPSGLSEKGLPLGMQLAGSFYQDEKLISDAVSFSRQPQEN